MSNFDDLSAIIAQKVTGAGSADSERAYLSRFAPNIIQWVTGVDYWNVSSTFNYSRQYQILRDFFNLRCKLCNSQDPEEVDCWGKGREYLESEVLLEWSDADSDYKCPKCGNTLYEFAEDGLVTLYNEMCVIAGMRSGKSFLGAHIGGYIEHILRVYAARGGRSAIPRLFPNLEKAETFEVTFAASTATQAKDTIYAKYRGMRVNSPWMNRAVAWVKEQEALQLSDVGRWEYKELDDIIRDGYLQVRFNKVSSNSGGIAGRTRILAGIDELSRLSLTDSKMSAQELYRVLNQSLKTVRGSVRKYNLPFHFGLMLNVTSPISIDDAAMSLYAKAVSGELKRTYFWKGATWEFNPELSRADFDEEYKKDPVGAERDFGANPPAAATPYVDNPLRFWKSIDYKRKPEVKFVTTHITDKTGKMYVGAEVAEVPYNWKDQHYIFCDAGHTFDSFAIVCAHPEIVDKDHYAPNASRVVNNNVFMPADGGHITNLPCNPDSPMMLNREPMQGENLGRLVTVIDFCYRIVPTRDREIYFNSLLDIIKVLKEKWKIATVAFDQWQSVNLIQAIRDLGIQSNKVNLKSDDFMAFLQQVYNDQVNMLPPDPTDNVFLSEEGSLFMGVPEELMSPETVALVELLKLERSADLKRVIAPRKGQVRGRGSDDVARCVVGVNLLIKDSVVNRLDSGRRRELVKRLNATGSNFQPKLFNSGQGRF